MRKLFVTCAVLLLVIGFATGCEGPSEPTEDGCPPPDGPQQKVGPPQTLSLAMPPLGTRVIDLAGFTQFYNEDASGQRTPIDMSTVTVTRTATEIVVTLGDQKIVLVR